MIFQLNIIFINKVKKMCLRPIQIYNKSNKISYRGSALIYTIPCGQCEECKKLKSSEYILRSYIQYMDTVSKGGYAYFDTLTYNDENLPIDYGIEHFRRRDVTLTLKRLRVNLERAGYAVKDNLKYFVTSEYGGINHRPHFHCIFYITIPNLDPRVFWKFLNKSWIYGFIDKEKGVIGRVVNSTAALNYVAKYVQKDQEWQNVVDSKIYYLENFNAPIKDYQPFHLQSQGYGANFLNFIPLEDIIKNGYIEIPDKQFIKKKYALPNYYKRKLFYYHDKDKDGKIHWHLNDRGLDYKVNRLDEQIEKVAQNYKDIYNNLNSYNIDPNDKFDVNIAEQVINAMLDDRSYKDFATYVLVYRNKMWNDNDIPDYKTFYKLSLLEGDEDNDLYSNDLEYKQMMRFEMSKIKIHQDRCHEFREFDELYHIFQLVVQFVNYSKDQNIKKINNTRNRLKKVLQFSTV